MRIVRDQVTVSVPASSANLGPGFDALGLALELRDEVTVYATTGTTQVTVEGEGAGQVSEGEDNLVVQSLRLGLETVGAPQVGIEMRCLNRIPHGRGLGSSSAAIVSGLAAASALLEPGALPVDEIFQLAAKLEGHPDNAAPAVYGGAVLGWIEPQNPESSENPAAGGEFHAFALPFQVHPEVKVTVLIPPFELATSKARGLLPETVPHRDAVFNASRAALLPLALSTRPDLLFYATQDRLHQEYRREGMPASLELVDYLRSDSYPAAVSGAGPTVMVFSHLPVVLRQALEHKGWQVRELPVAATGIITS